MIDHAWGAGFPHHFAFERGVEDFAASLENDLADFRVHVFRIDHQSIHVEGDTTNWMFPLGRKGCSHAYSVRSHKMLLDGRLQGLYCAKGARHCRPVPR